MHQWLYGHAMVILSLHVQRFSARNIIQYFMIFAMCYSLFQLDAVGKSCAYTEERG